jgi:hypothetical protein
MPFVTPLNVFWPKRIFSLARIFINLKRCHIQSSNFDNLAKLIFVHKNWPSDPKVGCKSLSRLIKLIVIDADLEK